MVPLRDDYTFDIPGFIAALTPRTRMIMFSNPSNPVGASMTADDMCRLLAAIPDSTILMFDEAYFDYGAVDSSYPPFIRCWGRATCPGWFCERFRKLTGSPVFGLGMALRRTHR